MSSSLPRSTPADQRVDPAAILSFLDAVDERPDIEMHSLMVVRHGRVVAEGWWAPYSAGRPQLLYSLSKSFTSTAAAFAQAEGLLDLDDTVISHFAEFAAGSPSLAMSSVRACSPLKPCSRPGGKVCHTLRAEVIFLETPHRMDITCSLPGRTAEAVWRHRRSRRPGA